MRRCAAGIALAAVVLAAMTVGARAAGTWTPPPPAYQLNDAAVGHALSILPPGEHGLVNAADAAQFEANGTRPQGSQDQLGPYANLLYNAQGLADSQLTSYFNDESFGIPPGQVTRTETPSAAVNVVIYRDQHDVAHIYGEHQPDVAYGAGYAAAEDRLFEMDVLRHYGAGDLSQFLGPSCADERMDHNSLLLGGYTTAQKQAQIDNLAVQYGQLGATLTAMVNSYVAGINAYVAATTTNPALLPADYAAAVGPPQPWSATDIIDIATLVGGIFGKGGGNELANARMLQYLQHQFGAGPATTIFSDFKEQNDPAAPTTAASAFPYGIQGTVNPATTAMPDDASAPLTGGPTDTTSNCSLTAPSLPALQIIASLLESPHAMSNALLVDAAHSVDGHPIAVMGPQVGYFTPQILMEQDLHATDGSYDVEGASFPGTNFLVELGRGRTFAWSATSAETDNIDQRLELVCDPGGGAPAANGTSYMFNGACVAMQHQTFSETAFTKPGGQGAPVVITHDVYYTVHGVVQGWTSAGGHPAAVVNQRSTYNHEVDSGVGFLRWGMPSQTFDPQSWMAGAAAIQYTFNWFYIDTSVIAYYESGLLPIRPAGVDPNLPSWGTGIAEWQGFLDSNGHVHQVGSPTGYLTSWNNKGAPQFSAADDKLSWGPVQRVQSLNQEIAAQLAAGGGRISRAQLVTAMETAAAADLDGRQLLPLLLPYAAQHAQPAGVQAMLAALQQWLNDGSLRRKTSASASQYAEAAAVAIMDQLVPNLQRAIFDPVFGAGGVFKVDGADAGYSAVPMGFAGAPNSNGAHSGSSYQDGWEGYAVKVLKQIQSVPQSGSFSSETLSRVCGPAGIADCDAALSGALSTTYQQLVSINGSTDVSTWTSSAASRTAGQAMPVYDDIHFSAVGVVGQPAIDWQNRPTFQQVVEFPSDLSAQVPESPWAPGLGVVAFAVAVGVASVRRRSAGGR